jgi:hypothetical protein
VICELELPHIGFVITETAMTSSYGRFLRLLESWPVDSAKGKRDLGLALRCGEFYTNRISRWTNRICNASNMYVCLQVLVRQDIPTRLCHSSAGREGFRQVTRGQCTAHGHGTALHCTVCTAPHCNALHQGCLLFPKRLNSSRHGFWEH